MTILYNLLQLVVFIVFFPFIVGFIAIKKKYRSHIPRRLGMGLQTLLSQSEQPKKTIWVHALSVGEVTSALPLVTRMRDEFQEYRIVFSSSTRTGYALSRKMLSPYCDAVIPSPLDILPVCWYYLRRIKPDAFILVETDLWPNLLLQLRRHSVTTLLVNARLSATSMSRYSRYSFFFQPLFQTFQAVCTQTREDRQRFIELGVAQERTYCLGNLKFEPPPNNSLDITDRLFRNVAAPLFLAGSTHPGEEEILMEVYIELRADIDFRLMLAPRDPARATEVETLAKKKGLRVQRRTANLPFTDDVFIIDTIGELMSFYRISHICFIGGSLVEHGGHNPLEPASQGKPVLFGPDMSDFSEISRELVDCGGAFRVSSAQEIKHVLTNLLTDGELCTTTGNKAMSCVAGNKGVVDKHLALLKDFI